MSKSMDQLAQYHKEETADTVGSLDTNIRAGMNAGMSVEDVMSNFNFPKSVDNPYQAIASVAIGKHYGITPEKAYGMYPVLKETLYPNITDEDLVGKLFTSSELPQSTVTREHHAEEAKKDAEKFPAYAKEREEAELDIAGKAIFQSQDSYEKQSKPVLKEAARKHLDDEWFGKGSQRDIVRENYYDAMFLAKSDEERQHYTQTYIKNLGVEQKHRLEHIKRLEYQIENHTSDEGFWTRKYLAGKRGFIREYGAMSRMAEVAMMGLDKLPNTEAQDQWIQSKITTFRKEMRMAHFKSMAPELWREELNWWDGATNAVIENTPTMMLTATAAALTGMTGGTIAAKAGIMYTMGAAESYDVYAKCIDRGFTEEESTKRANIAFVLNGGIEAVSGGVMKYKPSLGIGKRLVQKVGKFGKNILREVIFEEIPQEIIQSLLTGDVPYKPDGTLDKDAIVDQLALVIRDAAFMAGTYGGVSMGVESVSAHRFKTKHGITKDEAMIYAEKMESMVNEARTKETDRLERIKSGEMLEGEDAYTDDLYIKTALAEEIQIGDDEKGHAFMLVRNTGEDAAENPWHIVDKNRPDNNLTFKTYSEALNKYMELAPIEEVRHSVYKTMEQMAPEVFAEISGKSPDYTEPLSNIGLSTKYYMVKTGRNEFDVIDADTGETLGSGLSLKEATKLKANNNIGTGTNDLLVELHRFAKSRADNGALTNIYGPIAALTDAHKNLASRQTNAQKLVDYLTQLRKDIQVNFDKVEADRAVPQDFLDRVNALPDMVGDLLSDHTEISNILREIIRKGQLYGEGLEAEQRRNWIFSWPSKVKKNKRAKEVTTQKQAEAGMLEKAWDAILGTSKDDHITSALHMFGNAHIPLSMKIIKARTRATAFFDFLIDTIQKIQDDLEIGTEDHRAWSNIFSYRGRKADLYPVVIGGQTHDFTMAQLMYMNLIMRDGKVMKLIQEVGLSFGKYDLGNISEAEMIGLTQTLAENRKALAFTDMMQSFYTHERGDVVNMGSMDMLGHILVSENSFIKVHQKDGNGPVLIQDIFGQVIEDARMASHYAGIKPTMDQIASLTHNRALQMAVQKAGKTKHLSRFREEMDAMNKSRNRPGTTLERAITRLGANRARSILANGRIATLQAGSYQLYMAETSARYMRGGKAPQEIYETWDLYQFRSRGMGSVHSVASRSTVKKSLTGKQPVLDFTLYPMHKVDLAIIKQAALISWHEMTDKILTGKARRWWDAYGYDPHSFKVMSPEFLEALHDRADYLASTSQPMFFPESRNVYSTSDSPVLREMARFRSFTDQLLRSNARQIALWRMGEISQREMATNLGRNIIFASVWYNGLRWIFDEIFRDEDEEAKNLFLEIVLGPLSWIPFLGWPLKSGVSALINEGSGYGPADFTTITFDQVNHTTRTMYTLSKAIKYSLNDEKDSSGNWKAEKYWRDGMREAAKDILIIFFGLPDYLVDVIPEEEKGKKRASQFRIH